MLADNHEIETLADAMWQLLDDMRGGLSVSLAAKAQARIAFEPFKEEKLLEYDSWMTLDEARQILRQL